MDPYKIFFNRAPNSREYILKTLDFMDPKNQLSTELMNPEQPDISPKNNFQPSLMDHEQPSISPNNNQPGISPKNHF